MAIVVSRYLVQFSCRLPLPTTSPCCLFPLPPPTLPPEPLSSSKLSLTPGSSRRLAPRDHLGSVLAAVRLHVPPCWPRTVQIRRTVTFSWQAGLTFPDMETEISVTWHSPLLHLVLPTAPLTSWSSNPYTTHSRDPAAQARPTQSTFQPLHQPCQDLQKPPLPPSAWGRFRRI